MFDLRDYQEDVVRAVRHDFAQYNNTMAVLPTGSGKTVIFSELIRRWDCTENPRAMVICPMIQLVDQAADKIKKVTGVPPAIEQGSRRSNESTFARSPFVVASKQTLVAKAHGVPRFERFRDIGLVVVDECHLAATHQYKELIDHFVYNGAKVFGCTATPKRHDGKALGLLFENCSYNMGIKEGVEGGWLVDSLCQTIKVESLDLSDVSSGNTSYGKDFNQAELGRKLESLKTVAEIATITAAETKGEKTVVFCASVDEAHLVSDRLRDNHGIESGWICSDTKLCTKKMRQKLLNSFADPNGITHLCNVGILTTGWDCPILQNIVMARPTQSEALYTQIYGRGTRPLEGVVDFQNSTADLRREAILHSDKPRWRMIDLVDASLSNKVVTAVDVLGGCLNPLRKKKAKMAYLRNQGRAMGMDEAFQLADEELEREKQERHRKRREREARRSRANVKAQVNYNKNNVNPYGQKERVRRERRASSPVMRFGKHKDKLMSEVPTGYLEWVLKNFTDLYPSTRNQIRHELDVRKDEDVDIHDGGILHG